MLTEDMLQLLLQQMFKMASHSMDTNLKMSSPFVSCLIDNCLLYTRPDRTQMLLQLVFQNFQKSLKLVFVNAFVANSFTDRLAPNLQTHGAAAVATTILRLSYRFIKIKCDCLYTDPFPWLASSDVDGCNGNKISWHPVLSKFTSYIPEDSRLFVDLL